MGWIGASFAIAISLGSLAIAWRAYDLAKRQGIANQMPFITIDAARADSPDSKHDLIVATVKNIGPGPATFLRIHWDGMVDEHIIELIDRAVSDALGPGQSLPVHFTFDTWPTILLADFGGPAPTRLGVLSVAYQDMFSHSGVVRCAICYGGNPGALITETMYHKAPQIASSWPWDNLVSRMKAKVHSATAEKTSTNGSV